MAKIDFVVPCYNYAHYLPTCVNSLLRQSVQDLRVLIINDASPDDTRTVADKLAAQDRRVSVIHHAQNVGMIGSINEGIEWANSPYLLLISADDIMAPGAAARAIDVLDANPDVGLVYGRCPQFFDANVPQFDIALENQPYEPKRYEGRELISIFCDSGNNFVETPTAVVRTALQKQIGGYLPQLTHCSDFDMWLRFAAHGAVIRIDAIQGWRRDHPAAMNKQYFVERWPDFKQRKETFDILFANYSDRISGADQLQQKVNDVFAADGYWTAMKLLANRRFDSARKLFQFVFAIDPSLKFRPPVGWLWRRLR